MFQEWLATLSIRCTKSDELRQTYCNEILDNFFMKKAGQKLLFTVLCSALLDSMTVGFYFFIRISMMTA